MTDLMGLYKACLFFTGYEDVLLFPENRYTKNHQPYDVPNALSISFLFPGRVSYSLESLLTITLIANFKKPPATIN